MALQKTVKVNPFFNFFIQFLIIAIVFFAIGFAAGQKKISVERRGFIPEVTVTNSLPPANQNVDFSLFWNVWETLPKSYIDKSAFDGQKLLYGAISGMVRSLGDPYTAFLSPDQNDAVKDELAGSYEGVGIQIGFNENNRLVVIAPLKGTPAEEAGLLARDFILKIGEKDTLDITLPEAVDLIRGPAGTKVKLLLGHEGETETYEVEIARAKINVRSVDVEFKNTDSGEIAIIKVSRFGDKTNSEWDEVVGQVLDKNVKGVVVDMRNNPGGLLTSSIYVASEFVGGTVVKQELADGSVESLAASRTGKMQKTTLIVLVNEGSASASEIFAGAIQDKGRAKIVGQKTFGKGTVQDVVDLPGGAGLHITIAKWLTPDGNSIHGEGIKPDIEVSISKEQRQAKEDPQLDRAVEEL